MYRALSGGLLSAAAAMLFVSGASAANTPVQRDGNTYYRAVCGRAVAMAARCHSLIVTDKAGHALANSVAPPVSGKTPTDLRDAYKITADGNSSTIVALVDAFGYDNAEADLGTYRSFFGLPKCTTRNGCFKKLNQRGKQRNYPAQDIGWAQESALDVDMASAMCPNCQVWLVEANNNSFKNLGTAVDTAATLGAHVISNSYGGTEGHGVRRIEQHYDHPGVAVTASTGDGSYSAGPQAPADMPSVIAVGGTALVTAENKRGWTETVWSGAGSGCSAFFRKPKWQKDPACPGRMIGDVSADAAPSTGVAVFGPNGSGVSQWLVFGGTSVAAPLVGGVFGANGGSVNAAKTIYAHAKNLFDVKTGSNGTCTPPEEDAYFCTGEVGYDGPTGLGTPHGTTAFGD